MPVRFNLNMKVSLLTLLVLPLLVFLGLWQLSRAEEKNRIQTTFSERVLQAPLNWSELPDQQQALAFLPVKLRGEFASEYNFLLDNRTYQGRVGYEVLTPFRLVNGQWVLINRGWIAALPRREQLPNIPAAKLNELIATVYVPDKPGLVLTEQDYTGQSWPVVIQAVAMDQLSELLSHRLYPYQLRLPADSMAALIIDWPVVTTSAEKHTAYAVQWFAMAAVLLLWFLLANTNLWQLLKSRQT